ncbi:MAG: cell wall-active antibiotics response protein [Firmicutes bacterium]|jgi:hypothetical protein|nr:cell wall-active antibiotics response protein [Bacillota bacterium]HKM18037.1 LiaF domain-containing protein [Limnochordia bacterium]
MRRLAVAVVAAFFVAVEFLRWQGIIDFGALYVFSHTWYLIPMWYGIKLAQQKSKSMKTSGFVLIVFAGFMLIMSMIELFSETQDSIYYITVAGTLIFWPLVMIMFFLSVLVSLFDKGEEVHKSFLTQRTVECPEQELLDTSLSTVLGKLTFVMNLKSVSHRAVRLDILALFGKVEIVVPEDVGVLAEQKALFAAADVLGKLSRKLVGGEVVRSPAAESQNPRLLLVIRSCFGSVAVKYESRRS